MPFSVMMRYMARKINGSLLFGMSSSLSVAMTSNGCSLPSTICITIVASGIIFFSVI